MNERLPQWIKSEEGALINLAHVARIHVADFGQAAQVLCEMEGGGSLVLAHCHCEERAQEVLDKLTGLLPIAILDVDLDIIADLDRTAAR